MELYVVLVEYLELDHSLDLSDSRVFSDFGIADVYYERLRKDQTPGWISLYEAHFENHMLVLGKKLK